MDWKAALYGRVSTEHAQQQESIRVQREFLEHYAGDNGYEVVSRYFDEGYSGTNFLRPGIEQLKKDIEQGRVNIVLVKDLSRIGRNNPHTLLLLDYFAQMGVRLIAVNDNYDTFKDDDGLVGIKTWFNELYSRELSRKIKFALRHKKSMGEYLTAFAPYGYRKSCTQKNKLEKDYFAANVVCQIFDMYINGWGFQKIAAMLQQKGIPNPSRYMHYSRTSHSWDWTMVRKIITSPVYTGCSLQQRYYKKSFKSKSISKAPDSQWIRVENTHEAIIDKETFELAQRILGSRQNTHKYRNGPNKPHLFSSFVFCHECGSPLYYGTNRGRGVYRCGKYIRHGTRGCTSHCIYEQELANVVSLRLAALVKDHIDMDMLIDDVIQKSILDNSFSGSLDAINEQIRRNEDKKEMLYKDRLDGLIDNSMFIRYMEEINQVVSSLRIQASDTNNDINSFNRDDYGEGIKKYISFAEGIDREILERLIRRIEVCGNGDVMIYYNFSV